MNESKQTLWSLAALIGGFVMSFVGLGILWAGVPWHYQYLMGFLFFLLALAIARFGTRAMFILVGAAPIGMLLLQFRDKDNSHLMPFLVVAMWVIGALVGSYFGARLKKRLARSA